MAGRKQSVSAMVGDDLVAFLIERGDPVVDARRLVAGRPPSDLRDFKQIAHLSVGQLDEEISAAVARVMAELPEEQRTAILLKEYHGLTFQEIADMQDCPLSTVKTRLYQGLSVLRRQLERSGVSGGFKNHV